MYTSLQSDKTRSVYSKDMHKLLHFTLAILLPAKMPQSPTANTSVGMVACYALSLHNCLFVYVVSQYIMYSAILVHLFDSLN